MVVGIFAGLLIACLVLGGWFAHEFLKQLGKIVIRLDALEQELVVTRLRSIAADEVQESEAPGPSASSLSKSRINRDGLAPESPLPPLVMESLDSGRTIATADYNGRSFMLILTTNECAPCETLLRRLAALDSRRAAERLLIVTRPPREAAEQKMRGLSLQVPVALQEGWEVSRALGIFKFPSAYVVDQTGKTLGPVLTGTDTIWAVAQALVLADRSASEAVNVA